MESDCILGEYLAKRGDRGSHWVTHDVLSYIQGIIYTIRE